MKMVSAMKTYFGLLPGQTLGDFAKEYRALSESDLAELKEMLRGEGYDIED